ncbi:hypothetical protein GW17_00015237 [Ensete ventricosum]|nr:hypothetical protein GW17_00015237 [Ensete ventricosum]
MLYDRSPVTYKRTCSTVEEEPVPPLPTSLAIIPRPVHGYSYCPLHDRAGKKSRLMAVSSSPPAAHPAILRLCCPHLLVSRPRRPTPQELLLTSPSCMGFRMPPRHRPPRSLRSLRFYPRWMGVDKSDVRHAMVSWSFFFLGVFIPTASHFVLSNVFTHRIYDVVV